MILESERGNEAQDRYRLALSAFSNYQRPRGGTALYHVRNYDIFVTEAMSQVLGTNAVGMTHFFLSRRVSATTSMRL